MSRELQPKDVYLAYDSPKAPSTANLTIVGDKVRTGRIVSIEQFFAGDQTTAAKNIRLGFRRGSVDFWLKRAPAGANTWGIYLDRPMILVEGEQPIAMIEAPTANDICFLNARGPYLR